MSTTIKITAAGRKFDFTPDEARALYDELRKVYEMPFVMVPSVWTEPSTFTPFDLMITTGEHDTYSVTHVRDTIRAEHV